MRFFALLLRVTTVCACVHCRGGREGGGGGGGCSVMVRSRMQFSLLEHSGN